MRGSDRRFFAYCDDMDLTDQNHPLFERASSTAPPGAERMMVIIGGSMDTHGAVSACPGILIVYTNAMGEVKSGPGLGEVMSLVMPWPPTDDDEEYMASYAGCLKPAMLAFGLMNCKNITTRQQDGTIRLPSTYRQRKKTKSSTTLHPIRYHVIDLPQPASTPGQGLGDGQRETARHGVRGHFKNYTTERPLMGRHTGTYWWGWHVRGNANIGEVVSDYRLGT
jgi:hypothetical protein